jgi:hypothetical protein
MQKQRDMLMIQGLLLRGTLKGPKQLLGWRTYAKSWRNSIRVS